MMPPIHRFNLVDEPWLPVVRQDGSHDQVGLRAVLVEAAQLRELRDHSPLVTVALHRLLLAIVHRVLDGPRSEREWVRMWDAGLPTADINEYLDAWHHRFDLFDPDHPFFQVGGLSTVDKSGRETAPAPVTVLRLDRSAGNNGVLFSHDRDAAVAPWTPAEAARGLVGTQSFTLGGGKGPRTNRFGEHPYASHASQVGGIAALLQGGDLERTLLLNVLQRSDSEPVQQTDDDRPVWERDAPHQPGATVPSGYLDYLTLPSRAVRLLPEPGAHGSTQVRHIFIAPGCSIADAAGVLSPLWVKRLDKKRGPVPLALRESRAIWRDASALFALQDEATGFSSRPAALHQSRARRLSRAIGEDTRMQVRCYGLVNDKAKPVAWREEELPASIRLLDDADLVAAVQAANAFAEAAARATSWGFKVCSQTLLTTEQKKPDPNDVRRLTTRMERHAGFWDGLERPFRDLLTALSPSTREDLLQAWVAQVSRRAEESYSRGARFAQGPLARRLEATVAGEVAVRRQLKRLRAELDPDPSPPNVNATAGATRA